MIKSAYLDISVFGGFAIFAINDERIERNIPQRDKKKNL